MTVLTSAEADRSAAAGSKDALYSFSAFPFPPGHFQVHEIRGREALSKPYWFDVTVTAKSLLGDDLERIAVGHRAGLVMRTGGPPRIIPGVVESVRSLGVRWGGDVAQTRFRVVPMMSLLRHQRGSRIFQDMRVDQVVDQVLHAAGISTRWDLTRTYPVRAYVTQYEESDLEFVQRILAEAGIFYRFGAPAGAVETFVDAALSAVQAPVADTAALVASAAASIVYPEETVVFGDDASTYPPIASGGVVGAIEGAAAAFGLPTQVSVGPVTLGVAAPTLYYLSVQGLAIDMANKVTDFISERRVRSDVAEYREFDPRRPQSPLVSRVGDPKSVVGAIGDALSDAVAGADPRVSFESDGGLSASASFGVGTVAETLLGLVAQRRLETYEHHGYFLFPDAKEIEGVAQRIRRSKTKRRVTAKGRSRVAALAPGNRFRLEDHPIGDNNQEHVVVWVEHRGQAAGDGPHYENWFHSVPAPVTYLATPQPRRTVQSLLTATVVGPPAEEIHVDTWGRIKVLFHWDRRGAGPDTSCWIRCVQPWAGAAFGHQFIPRIGMEVAVTFEGGDTDKPVVIGSLYNGTHPVPFPLPANKTQSGIRTQSTPGGGGFNELMFEDLAGKERIYVHAQRDLDEVVRRDHTLLVHTDETVHVMANRHDTVEKNAAYEVGGDTSVRHVGSRVDVVEKNLDQRVSGMRTTRVEGRDELDARSPAEHRYADDFTTRVTGNQTLVVGKHEAPRAMTIRVEGTGTFSTEDTLELASNKGITLRCGKTSIRIGADGIELQGAMVRTTGDKGGIEAGKDGVNIVTDTVTANITDKVVVQTAGSSLAIGTEFRVDSAKILLNSPDKATEAPPPEKKPPTEIELKDDAGAPLAGQRFIIELNDGSQRTGVTDKDGKAKLDLPSGGKIRFPELRDVASG